MRPRRARRDAVIRSLVIPTDGRRPHLLRRCIASHARQSELDGASLQVTVVDNSGHDATEQHTRAVLRGFAVGMDVRFIGCGERRRYVTHLVAELGGDDDLRAELAYALGPLAPSSSMPTLSHWPRAGSDAPARNVLQLDQVGHRYATADDDTTASLSLVPNAALDVWRDAECDPTEFWFFDSAERALESGEPVDFRDERGHLELAFMDALGPDVLVAQTGLVGDSAMSPSAYLLTRRGITRDHLVADYTRARVARHVRRGALAPTLSSHPHFMTVCAAFDGRALLPPFLPLERDADGLFGVVLRATTGSLIAHVPYCVAHDPGAPRPPMLSELGAAPTAATLVRLVIDRWRRTTDVLPTTRMQQLAAHLLEWSQLAPDVFEQQLCELRWAQLLRQAETLEQLLDLAAPLDQSPNLVAWRSDMREAVRRRVSLIGDPVAIHPPGSHARASCAALGRLLALWPAVVDAARRLAARGTRVGIEEPPF